jgi:hypothetical protein
MSTGKQIIQEIISRIDPSVEVAFNHIDPRKYSMENSDREVRTSLQSAIGKLNVPI